MRCTEANVTMEMRMSRDDKKSDIGKSSNQTRMRIPAEGAELLDEQEVPALLAHHVPPVNVLFVAFREGIVVDSPYVFEKFLDSSK